MKVRPEQIAPGAGVQNATVKAELLAAWLCRSADALGPFLAEQMTARTNLGEALRSNLATRVGPSPEEATRYLALQLLRTSNDGVLRVTSAFAPFPEVLSRLGPVPTDAEIDRPEVARFVRSLVEEIDVSVPYPERPAMIERLLGSTAAGPVVTPGLDAIQRVGPVSTGATASMPALAQALSYGAAPLFDEVARILDEHPGSALARALRGLGEMSARSDTDAGRAAMLLRLLDSFRGADGEVAFGRLGAVFGSEASHLVTLLESAVQRPPPPRPAYDFLGEIVEEIDRIMPKKPALELVDALVRHDALIPREVPALDAVADAIPNGHFDGRGLIGAQHLFPTLVPLLEHLIDKGMDPADVHVLGTPYTRNGLVAAYCRMKGMDVRVGRDKGGATRAFEEDRREHVREFLGSISSRPAPRNGFKVLDDGGMLHLALHGHDPEDEAIAAAFAAIDLDGVEQTTRGLTELEELDLKYGVVKVADAPGKIEEGRIIGWSLANSLLFEMRHAGLDDKVKHITVVSAGTVGLETAERLRRLGYEVEVVDRDPIKRERAEAAGFTAHSAVSDTLDRTDLVFACTGKRALNEGELIGFKGVVASGSSAAIEGDLSVLYPFARTRCLNLLRPMNFQGDGFEDLNKNQIGLTRGLLLSALAQDVPKGQNEPIPLAEGLQQIAVDTWKATGGERLVEIERSPAPVLERPDLNGRAPHRDWMTFFNNHPGPVTPPPNQTRFGEGSYIFQDVDGTIRHVDTRTGESMPLGLEEMPEQSIPAAFLVGEIDPTTVPRLLTGGVGDEGWARTLSFEEGAWRLSEKMEVGELRAHFMGNDRSGNFVPGLAFCRGDRMTLFRPEMWDEPITVPAPHDPLVAWPTRSQVICVTKKPAELTTVEVEGVERGLNLPVRLPPEMVEAVGTTFHGVLRGDIVVGRDAAGRTMITRVHPPTLRAPPTITLPEGAEFRGLRPADKANELIIDFLPHGAKDELSHYESRSISLFDLPEPTL